MVNGQKKKNKKQNKKDLIIQSIYIKMQQIAS